MGVCWMSAIAPVIHMPLRPPAPSEEGYPRTKAERDAMEKTLLQISEDMGNVKAQVTNLKAGMDEIREANEVRDARQQQILEEIRMWKIGRSILYWIVGVFGTGAAVIFGGPASDAVRKWWGLR